MDFCFGIWLVRLKSVKYENWSGLRQFGSFEHVHIIRLYLDLDKTSDIFAFEQSVRDFCDSQNLRGKYHVLDYDTIGFEISEDAMLFKLSFAG